MYAVPVVVVEPGVHNVWVVRVLVCKFLWCRLVAVVCVVLELIVHWPC